MFLQTHIQKAVQDFAQSQGDGFMMIGARIEEELADLDDEEAQEFLSDLGVEESGLDQLARTSFDILGLQTYLTTGPKETRAWTIKKGDTAPQAAGVIHSDFETGFIRANIVSFEDFVSCQGLKMAKKKANETRGQRVCDAGWGCC